MRMHSVGEHVQFLSRSGGGGKITLIVICRAAKLFKDKYECEYDENVANVSTKTFQDVEVIIL